MTICKLCKRNNPLIKKSHIIPNFLYKELYDEKHSLIKFNTRDFNPTNSKISKIPTGDYEGGILCQKCEAEKIGKYESYLSNILNNQNISKEQKIICNHITDDTGLEINEITNIDYKMTKLCLLSILWRTNISTRPSFKEVNLGKYEEMIRTQLISENPNDDDNISILIMSWCNDENAATDIIGQPRRHKFNHKTHYSIVMLGYIIIYYISPQSIPIEFSDYRLKSNNSLTIIYLPKGEGMNFFVKYSS